MTFILFTLVTVAAVGLSALSDAKQCQEVGKALRYETEWHFWSGCVVTKPDGHRVLLRQMRDIDAE